MSSGIALLPEHQDLSCTVPSAPQNVQNSPRFLHSCTFLVMLAGSSTNKFSPRGARPHRLEGDRSHLDSRCRCNSKSYTSPA